MAFAFGTVQRMEDADLYYCTENRVFSGVIRALEQRPTELDDVVSFRFFCFLELVFLFLCE